MNTPPTPTPEVQAVLDKFRTTFEELVGAPIESEQGQRTLLNTLVRQCIMDSRIPEHLREDIFVKFMNFIRVDQSVTVTSILAKGINEGEDPTVGVVVLGQHCIKRGEVEFRQLRNLLAAAIGEAKE